MEVEPGTVSTTAIYAALRDAVKAEGLTPILPKAGDRFVLDRERGVSFEVLFPDRDVSGLSTNDGSLVGKLSYGNVCAILTGDTTKGIEEYLVHFYGNILHCQLLKVAHHGSKTSSSPSFVAAVSPTYAAISDGKNNKYGHPHKETLDTLNNLGVKILRTDEIGTIIFQTDGRDLWHK
jgi:competence protein ComEC